MSAFSHWNLRVGNYTPQAKPIIRMGDPFLLHPSSPIDDPTSQEAHRTIADMIETIKALERVGGLAAPQIGYHHRIFIFSVPEGRDPEYPEIVPYTAAINPFILELSDETFTDWERCFSLPDFAGKVTRPKHLTFEYQTLEGKTEQRKASGYFSRLVQHEMDHLDGILYPSRMSDMTQFGYVDEIRKSA